MNTLNIALSWIGCFVLLYGLKLIGEQKKNGFYVALVAELMWIIWGIITHSWALVGMSVAISIMYVRAIVQWGSATKSLTVGSVVKDESKPTT